MFKGNLPFYFSTLVYVFSTFLVFRILAMYFTGERNTVKNTRTVVASQCFPLQEFLYAVLPSLLGSTITILTML